MRNSQLDQVNPKMEWSGDIIILTFTDGTTHRDYNRIATELAVLPEDIGTQHLFLNFAEITQIGSLELGTLLGLHKKMKASGGRLTLFNLAFQVYGVFEVTKLHTLMEICRAGPQHGFEARSVLEIRTKDDVPSSELASFPARVVSPLHDNRKDDPHEQDQCHHGSADRSNR